MADLPVFGIDLGYGDVKVAGPGYRRKFPAVAVEPEAGSDALGLVEWDGHRFIVGDGALEASAARHIPDVDKFIKPEEQAKYMMALAHLARHYDSRTMIIASGLPPAHYQQRDLRARFEQRLQGIFEFRLNGLPYRIEVAGVSTAPQGGAAFYDLYCHDDGAVNDRNADLAELRSIVVDTGFRTTDIALMAGLKAALGSRSILTVNRGVWSIFEEVSRMLVQEPGVELSDIDVERLWRTRETLRYRGKPIPLNDYVATAAASVARYVAAVAKRHAGDVRLWDTALLVGGGAHFFEGVLSVELGVPVRMPREPEFANAAGYFKLKLMR